MEKTKTLTELLDEVRWQMDKLTPKQLQDWCNSKECFDYLNR